MRKLVPAALATLVLAAACSSPDDPATTPAPTAVAPTTSAAQPTPSSPTTEAPATTAAPATTEAPSPSPTSEAPVPETHTFTVTEHETFNGGWAMAWLPDGETLIVTEKSGVIKLRDANGVREVSGAPEVIDAGQGGLGDVLPGPTFATDGTIYLSWVEAGDGGTGAVVGRGTLDVAGAALTNVEVIWRQTPKVDGNSHFSHRLAIQGDFLFVSSGDRTLMDPAQEMDSTLGKILRLTLDGQPAADNPFVGEDSPAAQQFYSLGHRNVLGLEFDSEGRLWASEMGPEGGDELNLILPGLNYGWPLASNGSHYGGGEIPDHAEGDGFEAPKAFWGPETAPGSLMIYKGDLFPGWKGDAFLGALAGQALLRADVEGESATVAETFDMGARIRAVEEGPDGAIWLLEDGDGGRLLELRPEE